MTTLADPARQPARWAATSMRAPGPGARTCTGGWGSIARKRTAAGLAREIARRQTSPAELAAREAHRQAQTDWEREQRERTRRRLTGVIVGKLPVDPDDGTVIVGYGMDGCPLWSWPAHLAELIADAVLDDLDRPWA